METYISDIKHMILLLNICLAMVRNRTNHMSACLQQPVSVLQVGIYMRLRYTTETKGRNKQKCSYIKFLNKLFNDLILNLND